MHHASCKQQQTNNYSSNTQATKKKSGPVERGERDLSAGSTFEAKQALWTTKAEEVAAVVYCDIPSPRSPPPPNLYSKVMLFKTSLKSTWLH